MSRMMLHGLGDCTPELNCGCMTTQPFEDAAQRPDTTQPEPECPPTTTGPQTATQGRDQWADSYAAAKRFYGDSAPLALDKIRDILGHWTGAYGWAGAGLVGNLISDLQAILDTAQEPPMTNATPTPAEDPNLVRWTPQDGPLADAIANLPDGHPVTIRGQWGELHGTIAAAGITRWFRVTQMIEARSFALALMDATSASWQPPEPPWAGALVVVDGTNDLLWRGPDGLYRSGAIGDSDAYTAAEIELQYGPVTVLVDADGKYVEVPHA